tara:strand:- start:74 stop:823 length:750 start_codon:yes stop_codon:yes gene_type:complete
MSSVDIILTSYNKGKYLKETVDSILNQTFKNYRILIIDDNSNDNSVDIVKKYTDPRINLIQLKKNKGVYFGRNIGLRKSEAKYIAFIDADDYWESKKIEKQINFMEKFNHRFTYTDYVPFKGEGDQKIFKKKIVVQESFNFNQFINNSSIAMSSVIIERNIIKKVKFKKIKICEDYLFKCEVLKNYKAYKCKNVLMYYRITKNSLQSNKFRNLYWVWRINSKYNNLSFFKNLFSVASISYNSFKKYGFK